MADIYIRDLPPKVKKSLQRLAKKTQNSNRPSVNKYVSDLLIKHTAKEIEENSLQNVKD
jgi:hypothetical protein